VSLPNRFDIIFFQGKTFKYWFAVRRPDGTVYDLPAEGYSTGRMQVRASYDTPVLLELTTANGRINLTRQYDLPVGDPNRREWSGYLYASATVMSNPDLQTLGYGVYDFEIVKDNNPDEVELVMLGSAVLEREVTR